MRYAQWERGQKLHLVHEHEGGGVGLPLCGRVGSDRYRMTINVPLGQACKNCLRVLAARRAK